MISSGSHDQVSHWAQQRYQLRVNAGEEDKHWLQPHVYTHQGERAIKSSYHPPSTKFVPEWRLPGISEELFSGFIWEDVPRIQKGEIWYLLFCLPTSRFRVRQLNPSVLGTVAAVGLLLRACFRIGLEARCSSQGHAPFLGQLQGRGIQVQASHLYSGQSNRGHLWVHLHHWGNQISAQSCIQHFLSFHWFLSQGNSQLKLLHNNCYLSVYFPTMGIFCDFFFNERYTCLQRFQGIGFIGNPWNYLTNISPPQS